MSAIDQMLRRVNVIERMTEDVSGKRCVAGSARTRAAALLAVVLAWRLLGWSPTSKLIRTLRNGGAVLTPAWLTSAGYSLVTKDDEGCGAARPRQLLNHWMALRSEIGEQPAWAAMHEVETLLVSEGAPAP